MRILVKLTIANLKAFVRDKHALFWAIAYPLFFVVFFGVFLGNPKNEMHITIGVCNLDRGDFSKAVVSGLSSIPGVEVKLFASESEGRKAVEDGKILALLVIPKGVLARAIYFGGADFKLYINKAKDPQTVSVVRGIVLGFMVDLNQRFLKKFLPLRVKEIEVGTAQKEEKALSIRNSVFTWIVIGIVAVAIMTQGFMGTTIEIANNRENGVLKRFWVTPLKKSIYIMSFVLSNSAIGVLQAAVVLAVSTFAFNVQLDFNLPLLAVIVGGAFMFSAFGFSVSVFAKTVSAARGLANTLMFAFMLLSNVWFPDWMMPNFIKPVAYVMPTTYLADMLRWCAIPWIKVLKAKTVAGFCGWIAASLLLMLLVVRTMEKEEWVS